MPLNIQQAKVVQQWPYERPLLQVRCEPSGRYAFASSEDRAILRWDLNSGEKVPLRAHDSWVFAFAISPDGSQCLSGGGDGELIWWPLTGDQPARSIAAHQGWIRAIAVQPQGGLVATAGNDRVVRLWRCDSGELQGELTGHEKHVYSLLWHPTNGELLSGDLGGKIRVWNIADKSLVRTIEATALFAYDQGQRVDFGGVRTMAWSLDSTQLLAGGLHKASNPLGAVHEPIVLRIQYADGTLVKSHVANGITGGIAVRVMSLADGTIMAASGGGSGGWLLFWNADADATIHQFQLPNLVRDADLHPDGIRVVTTHSDSHLRVTALGS
jgi:WD40 repeat protein